MQVWSMLLLVAAVALGAYYLGQRSNPAGAAMARRTPAAVAIPTPKSSFTRGRFATGAGMTETGATWAIYTSLDRLTDRPLFGARFGNQTGAQLFNVLCANGRSVLVLDRSLVPSFEGATGNGKGVVAAIDSSRRTAARERLRVELRFDETPAELADVMPRLPGAFLRRVAGSRRIRTATEEFDTTGLNAFVERVISACGFESAPTEGVGSSRSKGQP